jgi:DNA-binding Xre family transcriptional regulator
MENLRNRLNELLRVKNIAVNNLENTLSLSNGAISKFTSGQTNNIGSDKLELLVTHFIDINCTWLLLGRGPMYKSEIDLYRQGKEDALIEYRRLLDELTKSMEDKKSADTFSAKSN